MNEDVEALRDALDNFQSGAKITQKMGLFLRLIRVVFTLFGVTLALKEE